MSVEAEIMETVHYTPIQRMRHSAAHVMAEAVQEIFPDAKFAIGPAIEEGFYYDFDLPRPLTPEDLPDIEQRQQRKQRGPHPPERIHYFPLSFSTCLLYIQLYCYCQVLSSPL